MITPYGIQHFHSLSLAEQVKLLADPVVIEEKYDGFSLYFKVDRDGKLEVATKRRQHVEENPLNFERVLPLLEELKPNMFTDLVYYCEWIDQNPMVEHTYDRLPQNGLVLWDVFDEGEQYWLAPGEKVCEARELGIECASVIRLRPPYAPTLFDSVEQFNGMCFFMNSSLGGTAEGIIIKNYDRIHKGLPLRAKVVF